MELTDRQIEILKSIKSNPGQPFAIDDEDISFLKNYGYIFYSIIPVKRSEKDIALDNYPEPKQVKCSLLDKAIAYLTKTRKEDTEERRHNETIAVSKEANEIAKKALTESTKANEIANNANKIATHSNILSIVAILLSLIVGVFTVIDILI